MHIDGSLTMKILSVKIYCGVDFDKTAKYTYLPLENFRLYGTYTHVQITAQNTKYDYRFNTGSSFYTCTLTFLFYPCTTALYMVKLLHKD